MSAVYVAGQDPKVYVASLPPGLSKSQRAMIGARMVAADRRLSEHEIAWLLRLGPDLLQSAGKILRHGEPDLIAQVDVGEIAVSKVMAKGSPWHRDIAAKAREHESQIHAWWEFRRAIAMLAARQNGKGHPDAWMSAATLAPDALLAMMLEQEAGKLGRMIQDLIDARQEIYDVLILYREYRERLERGERP